MAYNRKNKNIADEYIRTLVEEYRKKNYDRPLTWICDVWLRREHRVFISKRTLNYILYGRHYRGEGQAAICADNQLSLFQ